MQLSRFAALLLAASAITPVIPAAHAQVYGGYAGGGGVATPPGGTSGQLQFNNGGTTFGGMPGMSGDATLNTTTGVLTFANSSAARSHLGLGPLATAATVVSAPLTGTDSTGNLTLITLGSGFYFAGNQLNYTGSALTVPSANLLGGNGTSLTGISVGSGLSLTGGVLSVTGSAYTLPTASATVLGGVKVDNTSITATNGVISATAGGAASFNGVNGLLGVDGSSTPVVVTLVGATYANGTLTITGGGSGGGSYTLPIATPSALGGIKPDNTTIVVNTTTGVASATASNVTAYTGANQMLAVDGGSNLVPVVIGPGISFVANTLSATGSTYSLPTASTVTLGGVKVDGSSIVISNGVISASGAGGSFTTYVPTTAGPVVVASDGTPNTATLVGNVSYNPASSTLTVGGNIVAATAAGTNQSGATALSASATVVTTVASNSGVRLAATQVQQTVFNRGANTLYVYPPTGGQIEALGANSATTITSGSSATFVPTSNTQFYKQ